MWPFAEPVRMWLILGCQFTTTRGDPGDTGRVFSVRRVAAERMWRLPRESPVIRLVELGEKTMLDSGAEGVGNEVRVVMGSLSLRVSQTVSVGGVS